MTKNNFKITTAYFTEIASWRLWIMDLAKYNISIEKKDLIELFGIQWSEKALNLFICRNMGIMEKRVINGKNEYLINLFLVIPWIVKHIRSDVRKRVTKTKKLQ
jgi:hypothetical protein